MRYVEGIIRKCVALLKLCLLKLIYCTKISFHFNESISISTKIKIKGQGRIDLGKKISTRRNVEFNSNQGGMIKIGNGTFFNNNCIVASHEKIEIGEDCSFGPNVVIYDHDHDFKVHGGKKMEKYKTSPIKIGNNVWIGANVIILRGVTIGDNSVIAAGTIVRENVRENVIYHSKIENSQKEYQIT